MLLSIFLVIFQILGYSIAQNIEFELIVNFDQCEGKDVANYTMIGSFQRDRDCNVNSGEAIPGRQTVLMSTDENGKKLVNTLSEIVTSPITVEADKELYETIDVVISGPLAGKYLYFRNAKPGIRHLKKCSTIMGHSFLALKAAQLLIIDDLNINALISPTGPTQILLKSASTFCRGSGYVI